MLVDDDFNDKTLPATGNGELTGAAPDASELSSYPAKAISADDMQYLKEWFDSYVATYASDDPVVQMNIDLKLEHTRRVCRAAVEIGRDLGLNQTDVFLAETAALFHDVGRFEQFKRFRTFSDKRSVNHALFGVGILRGKNVLARLDKAEQELIIKSISFHNRAMLDNDIDPRLLLHSRLLRDADKLDIWWVATDYYQQKLLGIKNEGLELNLPDSPGISPEVYTSIMKGETVLFEDLKNLNDFKLLQTGWVYDVNFAPTLRRLKERGYLKILQAFLPDSAEVKNVFASVDSYIDQRLQSL